MKKFLRLSLVVFFTLLFNSCEKEEIIEEQARDSLVEELEISDALDWVNSGSSNTRTQLLMDEAYTQSLKNGNMVAIPYFLDKETGIYVRLLMTKINGEIKAKYITLIPELEYHLERGYSTRYKDMDGRINIFDSEGNFEVGYLFEDGVYNGTIYRQSTTSRLNGKCGDCLECQGTCLEEVVVVGDSPTDEDGFDFEDFWDYEDPLPFNDDRFEPGGGEEDYYYNEPEGAGTGGPTSSSNANWEEEIILLENEGDEISDIRSYIECFNIGSSASFTIYVDQPKPGFRDTWTDKDPSIFVTDPDVGHTFISITQSGITRVIGFYPKNGVQPGINPNSESVLIDDSGHNYDISMTTNISSSQLSSLLNFISNYNNNYNLNSYNCTDFGLAAGSICGLNLKDTYGSWPFGGGSNPGDLGEDIRNINSNQTDKNSGSAVSNQGDCKN